jgi:ABC-2 type transport system ATP-binding protein
MKVRDLLSYAATLYKKDCSKRIEELTYRLNLDVTRKIRDLSFGNKKKVGIVAGLLHSPKLLMLDEPTSGLDPLMQQTFFDILREENQKGVTILFSSHILSEVQKMCDRIAILKDGKVISLEDIETMRSNAYKKIILHMPETTEIQTLDMDGVSNFEQNGEQINFLFKGDVNMLLDSLRQHRLLDVLIEEPSLEEIFMHYYI